MTKQQRITGHRVAVETRDDGSKFISGYAAVFYRAGDDGTEYRLWDRFVERIRPGAFQRAIAERQDIRGLFNHEPNNLLGRSTSGTLRLFEDETGLRYEIDLPDTQIGRDVRTWIERGDISGSSFGFAARSVEWTQDGENEIRTLVDVDLFDVGPVTFPAYKGTTASVRNEDRQALEQERLQRQQQLQQDADAVGVAIGILELTK